jgi:hypothetical protein
MPELSFRYPHEQYDFSPWIFENLRLLEEFGLRITGKELEAWCNTGRVDILAEDEDGAPVIIENQFHCSDGSHFRRLVGYMNDFGARKAIWIAEEFNSKYIEAVEKLAGDGLDICLIRAKLDDSAVQAKLELVERFVTSGPTLLHYLPIGIDGRIFYGIPEACRELANYWGVSHDPLSEAYKKGLMDNHCNLAAAVKSYLDSACHGEGWGFKNNVNGCLHVGRYWVANSRGNDVAPPRVQSFARLDIFSDYTYSSHLKARRSIRDGQTLAVFKEKRNIRLDAPIEYHCICATPKASICIDSIARSYALNHPKLEAFLKNVTKTERLTLADILAKELSPSCNAQVFRSWLEIGIVQDYSFEGPRLGNTILATELGDSVISRLICYDQLINQEDHILGEIQDLRTNEHHDIDPDQLDSLYKRIKYGSDANDSRIHQYKDLRSLMAKAGGITGLPAYFLPMKTALDIEFLDLEAASRELLDTISRHNVTEWRSLTPAGSLLHSCRRGHEIIRSMALLFNRAELYSLSLACISYTLLMYPLAQRADYAFLCSIVGDDAVSNNIDGSLNFGEVKDRQLESGQFMYRRLSGTIRRLQEYRSRYSADYALGRVPRLLVSSINKVLRVETKVAKHVTDLAKERYAWMCRNLEVQPLHSLASLLQEEFSSVLCSGPGFSGACKPHPASISLADQLLDALREVNL